MVGEKVHYLKKKQAGSRRVPDKIQTVDHNLAGRDDQNKKCPRDDWLETVDLKYRYTIIGCLKSNNQRRKPTGIINTCQTSLDFLRIPCTT